MRAGTITGIIRKEKYTKLILWNDFDNYETTVDVLGNQKEFLLGDFIWTHNDLVLWSRNGVECNLPFRMAKFNWKGELIENGQ